MEEEIREKSMLDGGKADFTHGPLMKKIILYTIPIVLTGILQLLFNAADLAVAGQMSGETSLAAVGACSALINLIVNMFMGLSVGAGVAVAHDIGAGNVKSIDEVVHTSVVAAVIAGVLVAVFGFSMARPLLELMGTPDDALKEAVPYMKAYFTGMPACMVYNYCASILRSSGDTKRPLIFLTVSGVLNAVLNVILTLILGAGNGALSVGIASSASQYVAMILILTYMFRLNGIIGLDPKKLRIVKKQLWRIVKIGIPAGIQGTLFSVSNVLIQSTVNGYGTVVMAGNTAAVNLEGFIYISMNSVHQTAVTFVGQNVGAKKYRRIKTVELYCVMIVTIIGVAMGAFFLLMREPLLSIYAPGNQAAIQAGINRMLIIVSTYFFCGLMDVGCGIMRGMGKSITPMIVSLVGSCLFRIVWIKTICPLYPTDIRVLYISYPISWVITAGVHYIMIYFTKRKLLRSAENKEITAA